MEARTPPRYAAFIPVSPSPTFAYSSRLSRQSRHLRRQFPDRLQLSRLAERGSERIAHRLGGNTPPATVAGSLLFSPTTTSALSTNSGAGLWLNPTAGPFTLDLSLGDSAATVLIASVGAVGQTASSAITATQGLLLGNGGNYTLTGGTTATTANNVGTLAASVGGITFSNGNSATASDLTTGTIFGVAGVAGSKPVILSASGKLTLSAGAPVSGSDSGTAVTLVAGDAFTNNAGAGAIQAGGGGRFLVYPQNPANDNRGGLAYDFKQYNATTATPILGNGNGFLYSIAPTISLTAVTKIYDGTTALPPGSGRAVQFSGLVRVGRV